jgi:hypothetical protein
MIHGWCNRLRQEKDDMPRKLKTQKSPHNYKRDTLLILIALVVVVVYFRSENRFFFDASRTRHQGVKSHEKLVYAGPVTPTDLKLTAKKLAPVDRVVAQNAKHLKQIKIYIERQDAYGTLKDSTQLRFYTLTRYNNGATIKSVYTPCTLKQFPRRLARRLKDDLTSYLTVKGKHGDKKIEGFTNTM